MTLCVGVVFEGIVYLIADSAVSKDTPWQDESVTSLGEPEGLSAAWDGTYVKELARKLTPVRSGMLAAAGNIPAIEAAAVALGRSLRRTGDFGEAFTAANRTHLPGRSLGLMLAHPTVDGARLLVYRGRDGSVDEMGEGQVAWIGTAPPGYHDLILDFAGIAAATPGRTAPPDRDAYLATLLALVQAASLKHGWFSHARRGLPAYPRQAERVGSVVRGVRRLRARPIAGTRRVDRHRARAVATR